MFEGRVGYGAAQNRIAMRLLGHHSRIKGALIARHDIITAKKAKMVVKRQHAWIKMARNDGDKINQPYYG